jgi:predicted PurR-regulated permease PerM
MKDLKTTNTLLLIIVIPLIFYLLKILSFIFIPLVASMFLALLFLPLMRWLNRIKSPKPLNILIIILVILGILKIGGMLIQLSTHEILATDTAFIEKAEAKLLSLIVSTESFLGIHRMLGDDVLSHYFQEFNAMKNIGPALNFIRNSLSMTLMTAFFVVLLLSESINFQKLMNSTILVRKYSSVKAFMKIEKEILKFVKVKFIISAFTGLGFGLAAYFFNVSFPIFWGLFAFAINFVQMIGSIISVVLLSLFAFVELDPSGSLLAFILLIIAVQVLMGGILEPIFMGKSFKINVITVLLMLMLWGYLWGIPGLIMAIPITVFLKIIFEQFPKTQIIADIISGSELKA